MSASNYTSLEIVGLRGPAQTTNRSSETVKWPDSWAKPNQKLGIRNCYVVPFSSHCLAVDSDLNVPMVSQGKWW